MLALAVDAVAELVAHAKDGDHVAGHLGGALEVVAGAGGDVADDDLLGDAAAQEHGHVVDHLVARLQAPVLFGDGQRIAQRLAAADDGDLVDGVCVVEQVAHQRVAALVVGDAAALLLVGDVPLALQAGDLALEGLVELLGADAALVAAGGQQGGLVHEVGEVCAGEATRELGDLLEVDGRCQRLALGVDLEDLLATLGIGGLHGDLAVEAARAQQGGVEDVDAVGGGDEDDGLVLLEAVHLDQQLVEGLLALVVAAAHAGAALAADGVDLVDEDDGGGCLLGLREEVAHAGCAHAHEHLDEVRARDAKEGDAGLARDSLGEQGLAGARGAHQQDAAGDLGAHGLVLGGVVEEVLNLLELVDDFVDAGDVGEADVGDLLGVLLGLGLAKLHLLVGGARHLAQEEDHDAEEEQEGDDRGEQRHHQAVGGDVDGVLDIGMRGHELLKGVIAHVGAAEGARRLGGRIFSRCVVEAVERGLGGVVNDLGHAVLVHSGHELAGGDGVDFLLGLVDTPELARDDGDEDAGDEGVQDEGATFAVAAVVAGVVV